MKTLLLGVIFCVSVQCAWSETGTLWFGDCKNNTAGENGYLKLYIAQENGKLSGGISISGRLFGSGELSGTRLGDRIDFTTESQTFKIRWLGSVSGSELTGDYATQDGQAGTFRLQKVAEFNSLGSVSTMDSVAISGLMACVLELQLNNSITDNTGNVVWIPQIFTDRLHTLSTGYNITVNSVVPEWDGGKPNTKGDNLVRLTSDCYLFWDGPFSGGHYTRFSMVQNPILGAITDLKVVESTGQSKQQTDQQIQDAAFQIGAILGAAAVKSFLGGN